MKRSQFIVKKKFFIASFLPLLISTFILFTACVQGAGVGGNEKVPVTGITLDKTTLELTVGATGKLVVTVIPENATNKKVKWSSSNDTVASVSEDGIVTAKAAGEVIITVKTEDGSKTATCMVKVKATVEEVMKRAIDGVFAKMAITEASLPYINSNTQSSEEIEKYLSPLGLARKDDKPDSKLVLFYKSGDLDVDPNYKKSGKITYIWDRGAITEGIDLVAKKYASLSMGDKDESIKLPNPDPLEFDSIAGVLDWKWKNFKSDLPYFFTTTSLPFIRRFAASDVVSSSDLKGLRSVITIFNSSFKFAFKPVGIGEIKEPEFYFYESAFPGGGAVLDLEFTFVNRSNGSNVYSFYLKPYYYIKDESPVPTVDDGDPDGNYNPVDVVHMFKLSTSIRLSLEEDLRRSLETPEIIDRLKVQHNIGEDEAKNQIASEIKDSVKKYLDNFPPFADNFRNLNDWDVYVSFSKYGRVSPFPNEIWRNTYKITGEDAKNFWKICWE